MELPEETKIFLLEAYENLDQVEGLLMALEKHPGDITLLQQVFRYIHSIKGNSGFLGLSSLESLCHRGEALLDKLRSGSLKLSPEMASTLLELVDAVRLMLQHVEASGRDDGIDTARVAHAIGHFLEQ